MKSKIDKLEVDKLAPVPAELKKISDAANIEVIKKDVYDELVTRVNATDTSGLC